MPRYHSDRDIFPMLSKPQNHIYEWCRDHRVHHQHSETDADPHNAKRGFFFAHMGWLMVRKNPEVIAEGKRISLADLWADPVVRWQQRFYYPLTLLLVILLPALLPIYGWGELPSHAFALAVARYQIALHGTWCINSVAHLYGQKPYDERIGPVDGYVLGTLALGEGKFKWSSTCDL